MSDQRILVPEVECPIGRAVGLIGDRWTLLILRQATMGVARFDEFRDALGISDNILSSRLAKMVGAGLLVKVPYRDERRTRFEYRLTAASAGLLPVLHALARWGAEHTRPGGDEPAPMRIVHVPCGTEIPAGEYCPRCERDAERAEIGWLRPWRSPSPFPLAEPVGSA
jgi:DNA-binding HxlR family transcriptional regulator